MTYRLSTLLALAMALTMLWPTALHAEIFSITTPPQQHGVTIKTTIDTSQKLLSFEFNLTGLPGDYGQIGFAPSPLPAGESGIPFDPDAVISLGSTEWNFHPFAGGGWSLEIQYTNNSPPPRVNTVDIHYAPAVVLTGSFLTPVGLDNIQVGYRGDPPVGEEDAVKLWAYTPEMGPPDTDGDGVPDSADNCTQVSNPDQRDSNTDGFGNMCDGDLDGDKLTDTSDLDLYKAAHRTSVGNANYNLHADFNGAGAINTLDLRIYNQLHGSPPGPSCCGG